MPRRAALLALLLLAPAPAASAALPGENGAVAYVAPVNGTTTLLARSGSQVRAVLAGNVLSSPAWSPQGRRLAVVRSGPDGKDLWVVDHDGQGERRLTASATDAVDPSWSPSGAELAYAEGVPGRRDIQVVDAAGTSVRALATAQADERDPSWSSTGRVAYVVRTPRGDDLFTVAATGGRPRRLTRLRGNEHSPSWSPDGRRVAFVRESALWTVRADGRGARRVRALSSGPVSGPAWAPDGRRIAFAGGRPGQRRIYTVTPAGRLLQALSSRGADARQPDWQPAGADPVIAAAGDIACDPGSRYYNNGEGVPGWCGQRRTSDLLLRQDLWQVLPLGDNQNADGALEKFRAVYDLTWGRTKHLQRPVIGNHEYVTDGTGHFDYFNGEGELDGPAGNRDIGGYYSFDVGTWHVVALNSQCDRVPGGCREGSPQQRWLAQDLAANPAACTLAMWHHPRYSSHGGGLVRTDALWRTFAAAGGDVVLTGHHHFYERMAPIDGVRQFIIGVGGGTRKPAAGNHASSVRRIESTLGVLRMTLREGSYDWRFLSASVDPATDDGSASCH